MSAVATAMDSQQEQPDTGPDRSGWNALTRIVFRFCFIYFGLVCLTDSQITGAFLGWVAERLPEDVLRLQDRLLAPVLKWVGHTVFGVEAVQSGSGSGDQAVTWVLVFSLLVVAVIATIGWTLLARRRTDHRRLAGWFLLFIRLCVGGQMLFYGLGKVIPIQMPEPLLATLLQPYGNMTPMSVLWNQVGSSPSYEILLGTAEALAGMMLFIPRTAILGAVLALIDMAMVFVLDMNFDVPVRIGSGHLMLMSLVLLAPEAKRLIEVLVFNRPSEPSTAPYPFHTRQSRRIAALVQIAIGLWMGAGQIHADWGYWQQYGPNRPKPPLYGIWMVQDFTRDGQLAPPLLTDENRWQRVVFDTPGIMQYQRMDGTLVPAQLEVDTRSHHLTLQTATAPVQMHPMAPQRQPESVGAFTFQQPAPDRLRLDGEFNGHQVTVTLHRFDENSFPQRSRGFHWIQEYGSF
ncbi:DoxX family protein [Nocardia terpenica]|nr:DoxX family protein [Nocardia terpenica]